MRSISLHRLILQPCTWGVFFSTHRSRVPRNTPTWAKSVSYMTHHDYGYMEDVERLYRYRPGGYHPMAIGDRLIERYHVIHKLGYGAHSTIWLARDVMTSKYVAIKVVSADSSEKEADVLECLESRPGRGRHLICPLLGRFKLNGPNGIHPCLVTIPAWCSLSSDEGHNWGLFQLEVSRSIIAQIAMAVAHVHEFGYVHGDLHPGNILLRMPPSILDPLSEEQFYEMFDPPEPQPVIREDGEPLAPGVPPHVFSPVWMGKESETLTISDVKIALIDFGVAFCPAQETRHQSYTPLSLRPPEAHFEPTKPLLASSDIWSLACTIWQVLGRIPLFGVSILNTEDRVIRTYVECLGQLPLDWWEKWETRSKYFDSDGNSKEPASGRPRTLEECFNTFVQEPRLEKGMEVMGHKEKDAFLDMLRWMLSYQPGDRPSTTQVLETTWMKNWGIPACDKTWSSRDS